MQRFDIAGEGMHSRFARIGLGVSAVFFGFTLPILAQEISPRGPVTPAVTVTAVPNAISVTAGNSFSVDVVVEGLGDLAAPSLGAFDVVLAYDPSVVTAGTATLGTGLGTVVGGQAIGGTVSGAGTLNAFVVSLILPSDLNAQQAVSFTLFSVDFSAGAPGVSPFVLSLNSPLGDEGGFPISSSLVDGSIEVTEFGPIAEVPTLSQWTLLFLAALLVAAGVRRLGRKVRR